MLVRIQFLLWNPSMLDPINSILDLAQPPPSQGNTHNSSYQDAQANFGNTARSIHTRHGNRTIIIHREEYTRSASNMQTSKTTTTTKEDDLRSAALAELKDQLRKYLHPKQYQPSIIPSKPSAIDKASAERDMIYLKVGQNQYQQFQQHQQCQWYQRCQHHQKHQRQWQQHQHQRQQSQQEEEISSKNRQSAEISSKNQQNGEASDKDQHNGEESGKDQQNGEASGKNQQSGEADNKSQRNEEISNEVQQEEERYSESQQEEGTSNDNNHQQEEIIQKNNDSYYEDTDNSISQYHSVLSQKKAMSLLDSPVPTCIDSPRQDHDSIIDDETVAVPRRNVVYYKHREDYYPQNQMEERIQEKSNLSPAANDNRRQSANTIIDKATTRIHPGSIVKDNGMPIFKPSETSRKPKAIFRKLKTLVKKRNKHRI